MNQLVLNLAILTCMAAVLYASQLPSQFRQPGDDCDRDCTVPNLKPKDCLFNFDVETYATMSKACFQCPFVAADCNRPDCVLGDGFKRQIYTINRQIPSPQIRVCEGDTIVVHVHNEMENGEGTSIHWHGLRLRDQVFMDGVAMLTQCPIHPPTEMVYKFKATQTGTHWYHAHVGVQRGEGIAGGLVVKPRLRPANHSHVLDLAEHTIVFQDWFPNLAGGKGTLHLHANENNKPETILVNGRGPEWVQPTNNSYDPVRIPYSVFEVESSRKYIFRLISNAVLNCPVEVFVQGHKLTAIATDGEDIEPIVTDKIVVSGGERWDFILEADQPKGNYWMYFRGLTDCRAAHTMTTAIVRYAGATLQDPPVIKYQYNDSFIDDKTTTMKTLNPYLGGDIATLPPTNPNLILLSSLKSAEPVPDWLRMNHTVDKQILIEAGLFENDSPLFNPTGLYGWAETGSTGGTLLAQLNRKHGILPPFPYLSQYNDIPSKLFCDTSDSDIKGKDCTVDFCACINRERINVGEIVEIILVDVGYGNISNHPMHIHGNHLYIVDMGKKEGRTPEQVKTYATNRNLDSPVQKDTIMMPNEGYIIGRFKADNPGPWFFHCHNELHVHQGMSMVLEVGDHKSWPQNPEATVCGVNSQHYVKSGASGFKPGSYLLAFASSLIYLISY